MKTLKMYIIFLGLSIAFSFDQNSKVDSLKKVLTIRQSPEAKLSTLVELCSELLEFDTKEVKFYLDEAINLAQELKDSIMIARIYRFYGDYYYARGDYNLAGEYLMKAVNLAERYGEEEIVEAALNILAVVSVRLKTTSKLKLSLSD